MSLVNNWNCSQAMLAGAFVGTTYALLICAVTSLLSMRTIGLAILALIIGAAVGAGIIGGLAAILNFARASLQTKEKA
ncbi:MAG: hypothetical protein ACOH12_04455 [Parvibaculaceae bacterium]